MERYRVTAKHPYLKEGLIVVNKGLSLDYGYTTYWIRGHEENLSSGTHKEWLSLGWLKKVGDLKFSEKDVIRFGMYSVNHYIAHDGTNSLKSAEDLFNEWIK